MTDPGNYLKRALVHLERENRKWESERDRQSALDPDPPDISFESPVFDAVTNVVAFFIEVVAQGCLWLFILVVGCVLFFFFSLIFLGGMPLW